MNADARRAAEEHFQRGNQFDEKGQAERALEEWERAIRLNPDHFEAHYNLGLAYADAGDNPLAIEELSEALRVNPDDPDTLRELGGIFLEDGRVDDAIAPLRQALERAPRDGQAARWLAEAYLAQSNFAEATRTLAAVARAADDADWLFDLGKSYERDHRRAQALWAYEQAVAVNNKHREAILGIERLTRTDSSSDAALAAKHLQRGNQFDESGDATRAIAEWQEALALDPDCVEARYNLGIAYADEGNFDLAIEELRAVIRATPLDLDARRELAEIFLDAGKSQDAIDELRQILTFAPDTQAAHLLAQTYFDLGMWDEAAGALEAGAMLEEDADLWFGIGKAYEFQQHRLDDAILAYRRALIANPDQRDARDALHRLRVPIEEPPDAAEDEE
jgi:tetratricopeptide (TPR) repeat protein